MANRFLITGGTGSFENGRRLPGVERAIREAIPPAREVIDTIDHSADVNPYYK